MLRSFTVSLNQPSFSKRSKQGCGIKGFLPTSVIQGNLPLYEENRLWEALSVVSQKWSFPTALRQKVPGRATKTPVTTSAVMPILIPGKPKRSSAQGYILANLFFPGNEVANLKV